MTVTAIGGPCIVSRFTPLKMAIRKAPPSATITVISMANIEDLRRCRRRDKASMSHKGRRVACAADATDAARDRDDVPGPAVATAQSFAERADVAMSPSLRCRCAAPTADR